MKIKLAADVECTGCGSCYATCSQDAICMQEGRNGYIYPKVDNSKCIECGQCISACPAFHIGERDTAPICYAARTHNDKVLRISTSGGVFYELASLIFQRGGCVYGCVLSGSPLRAIHKRATCYEELVGMHGSKYVQSEVYHTYRLAKEDLDKGLWVLFTGTPCQVSGLKQHLRNQYDHLVTMEVICHGVPSNGMLRKLQKEVISYHKGCGQLLSIAFRHKAPKWTKYAVGSSFENGESFLEAGCRNGFLEAFAHRLILRESCYRCAYNDGRSGADITVGDFWGLTDVHKAFNDGSGCSAVIIHSTKGLDLILKTSLDVEKSFIGEITPNNPSYQAERHSNPLRHIYNVLWPIIGFANAWRIFGTLYWISRFPRRLISKIKLICARR